MDLAMPDKQFLLFLDDVRLPADALIGVETPRSCSCSPG